MIRKKLFEEIREKTGIELEAGTAQAVSGGSIHEACRVRSRSGDDFFIKLGPSSAFELLETEKQSLSLLRSTGTIRVPDTFAVGIFADHATLIMEALDLCGFSPGDQGKLGSAMAELHLHLSPTGEFGAPFDNFIGATPQPNSLTGSWADFFTTRRLGHQFQLAATNGSPYAGADSLLEKVHTFLSRQTILPSLLHGDLWGGNASDTREGIPVVYDPASYYGDRETDIAFTKVFGGFDQSFYQAYREIHPEPPAPTHEIYNLYHLLNHDHLFGGHYRKQALGVMATIEKALN